MVRPYADVGRAAGLFKALAHPARLEIACRLASEGAKTQKQLIGELGWPQSTMARHLAPLRNLGLVHGERRGTEVLLAVQSPVVRHLMQSVCDWLHEEDGRQGASDSAGGARAGNESEVEA